MENQQDQPGDLESRHTRLIIDISLDLRRHIMIAAVRQDLSMKDYVEHILEQAVPAEAPTTGLPRRPVTRETLERLDRVREALLREHGGKLFEGSVEIIRQMREERSLHLEEL